MFTEPTQGLYKEPRKIMAAFLEKPGEDGLNPREIVRLANAAYSAGQDLFPVEIPASEVESQALGFINGHLYEAMDWELDPLTELLQPIMNNMELETPDGVYTLKLRSGRQFFILLTRNI